ncbi:hypothetical protein QYE76_063972 [Lolium multiflorum]|uniref:Uncharacterized protein n=1 Tax=Lolium multiflorum TaxID=4521 RepID=A0AAD8S8E6_LOLMU|nr:hypothetical protein QYE76_063972 [Lolium multiflorum]
MRSSDPIAPWTLRLHPEHLLADAYATPPSPCPFASSIAGVTVDLAAPPRPPSSAINRDTPVLQAPQQTCSSPSPCSPRPPLPSQFRRRSSNRQLVPAGAAADQAADPRSPELRHGTRGLFTLANDASTTALDRRRPLALSDPLPRRRSELLSRQRRRSSTVDLRSNPTGQMEPYVQTETYDLENGGSLVFERDLYLVSEKLERPPPKFHGVRIHNTPTGEQQWMITADLKGSSEPPISERILFSFKAYSWVDGLAHALQEGLARVCGQNIAALRGSRFAHFARHDTMGEPMALSSHPVLKIHVQHLDFMLHETRKDLELTRVHSHRAQMALAHHADAIRLLAKDRRSLRLQRAKNVATITRLREKIRTLEVTVRTQQDQIQEMEEDGEDILSKV